MIAPPETSATAAPRRLHPIVAAGLIAGVLDINAAFVSAWLVRHRSPAEVLKGVASALLGPAAFPGNVAVEALGLLMHFSVAFTVTAIFYGLSRRARILIERPAVFGPIYGAGVFVVMTWGVIPLTACLRTLYVPNTIVSFQPLVWQLIPQFFIHLTCVGLAIALAVKHWSKPAT